MLSLYLWILSLFFFFSSWICQDHSSSSTLHDETQQCNTTTTTTATSTQNANQTATTTSPSQRASATSLDKTPIESEKQQQENQHHNHQYNHHTQPPTDENRVQEEIFLNNSQQEQSDLENQAIETAQQKQAMYAKVVEKHRKMMVFAKNLRFFIQILCILHVFLQLLCPSTKRLPTFSEWMGTTITTFIIIKSLKTTFPTPMFPTIACRTECLWKFWNEESETHHTTGKTVKIQKKNLTTSFFLSYVLFSWTCNAQQYQRGVPVSKKFQKYSKTTKF